MLDVGATIIGSVSCVAPCAVATAVQGAVPPLYRDFRVLFVVHSSRQAALEKGGRAGVRAGSPRGVLSFVEKVFAPLAGVW